MRRDSPDLIQVGPPPVLPAPASDVIRTLSGIVTPARLARIDQVAARRTLAVIPILEGLTDPHNISAVLRSADAFGIQQVRVIEGPHGFAASEAVAKGAHRWLDVVRTRDAILCVRDLKEQGYIIATAAPGGVLKPHDLGAIPKVAVVFGNEHAGVSEAMRAVSDTTYEVPMVGFVESLNVSVAAAITLYSATRREAGPPNEADFQTLRARFLMNSVRDAERIVREALGDRST